MAEQTQENQHVVLQTQALTKVYGSMTVVNEVDLTVFRGERLVILGPNGAGKSTLLNILAAELAPSRGTVRLFGRDASTMPMQERVRLGMRRTFQHSQLMGQMTVEQHLALALQAFSHEHWSMQSALGSQRREAVHELAQRCHIEALLPLRADKLSHGQRRQLELAMTMGSNPRLLLLDEPAAGLSPTERVWLKDWIVHLDPQVTVLLIEHDMDIALSVADRVMVMQNGTVIFSGNVDQVVNDPDVQAIYLGAHAPHSRVPA
jgi:branched-chain amino acid transport system ATP-binding protein